MSQKSGVRLVLDSGPHRHQGPASWITTEEIARLAENPLWNPGFLAELFRYHLLKYLAESLSWWRRRADRTQTMPAADQRRGHRRIPEYPKSL
jgi:hypothetical protein